MLLSINERLQIIAKISGITANDIHRKLAEFATKSSKNVPRSTVYKWFDGRIRRLSEPHLELVIDFSKELLGEKYDELIIKGDLANILRLKAISQLPKEDLIQCLGEELREFFNWAVASAQIGTEFPNRSFDPIGLATIKKQYCGVFALYRKCARTAGVCREYIEISYENEVFPCKYYSANDGLFNGQLLIGRNQIYFLFWEASKNDVYLMMLSVARNDRAERLAGVSCSSAFYESTNPGARRVVLQKNHPTSVMRDSGLIPRVLPSDHDESIKFYRALDNDPASGGQSDCILINGDQYMEENISNGEILCKIAENLRKESNWKSLKNLDAKSLVTKLEREREMISGSSLGSVQ